MISAIQSALSGLSAYGPMIYEETSNGRELIEQSNADLAEELPAMSLNSQLYKANLKTLQIADEMLGSLLKTKV